jgi:hypothetical protein
MRTGEVVEEEMQRHRVRVVSIFLLNAFVNRVNRRIPISMVRFWRST